MAKTSIISSGFSFGEIDPKLQARVDFAAYARGVKQASNVLSIPQGGFTRRFGTRYTDTLTSTNPAFVETYSFIYDNSAVYCLVFEANSIKIYLENTLQFQVTMNTTTASTLPYPAEVVQQLSFVQIQDRLIILHQNYAPAQLIRSSNAANIITGVNATNNTITLTTNLVVGNVYPILFSTAGTLPVTSPQIYVNTLYYALETSANNIRIFTTPEDAAADINFYTIISVGAGVSNVLTQNTWTVTNIPFSNLPSYDFDFFPTYSAAGFTFTASATSGTIGTPLTITASGAIFTAAMAGGLLIGNGGIMRITVFTDSTHVNGYTYENFINTSGFPGRDAFLGEAAWSAARGYPSCGTFFQERFFLAGSRSIPNGLWGSTIFAVYDFNDAESLPDNAISFYPAAGSSNYIDALTSSKSLLVHTNTGNYSTPLTTDLPLTPANFSLTEQNKDGISSVIPVFIDNQIIYVDRSGKNIKSMFWDIIQSSYVNTNISLPSSHLVQTPQDMAVFSEPFFTDGYYIIAVNNEGNLAIYNSLTEQDVKGWTKANTAQNTTAGFFKRITSGLNRAWVIVQRTINGAVKLYLEELDFEFPVDCGLHIINTTPSSTVGNLSFLEGQTVQILADGAVLPSQVVTGGSVNLFVGANPYLATEVFVGLQFISTIEPLPININLQTGPNLYQAQHVRTLYIHYYNTIGMTVQGDEIPTEETQQVILNQPAIPRTGFLKYTLMEAWDAFDYHILISQSLPLPMTLLAIGYDVEVQ
jgi:hypothetical protein